MSLIGATAMLIAAIWLQTRGNPTPQAPRIDLTTALPMDVAGWRGRDLPLGPSEAASHATLETLGFDSYAYREYSQDDRSFSVYAVYWTAGRVSVHQTSGHTPDICWPANGWQLIAVEQGACLGQKLMNGGSRVFATPKGERVYVQFWLFVDRSPSGRPPPSQIIRCGAWWFEHSFALSSRLTPEQLFIRISSTEPIEVFEKEPNFRLVVAEIEALVEKTGAKDGQTRLAR